MNILFLGTSDFAILPLRALSKTAHKISLITKPDKPMGRGLVVSQVPLKSVAEELGIMVFQPDEILPKILEISPDVMVVVAYGKILSNPSLNVPRYGCINLHPSLLPKYRGPAPINLALINGEEKTGITVLWVNETVDGGDILLQKEVDILLEDNYESLSLRLSEIGGEALVEAISLIKKGEAKRTKQSGIPTYAPKIKEPFEIDFKDENKKIFNLIRGVPKDPGVWTKFDNQRIKVLKARLYDIEGEKGKMLGRKESGIIIGCGKGSIILDIIQKEGKKPISGYEFLCGIKRKAIIHRRDT